MAKKHIKNLFLDANIWLSLFHFSSDDLEKFKNLKSLIGTEIQLYVTEQVYDEVYRNRENKIKDALDKFEKFDISFPVFLKNYDEFSEFQAKFVELKKSHKEWIQKAKEDIINQDTPADLVLKDFFSSIEIIESPTDIIERGVLRFNTGNPPGKNKSFGDAINWETLIANVPQGEDLFFVSADKDFASVFDEKQFNSFLAKEWNTKKGSNIIFFKSLTDFLRTHVSEIELETENAKDELIEELRCSRSFWKTHNVVKELNAFSDWSQRQIEDICTAAIHNTQVFWLLGDEDVYEFYSAILDSKSAQQSTDENVVEVRNKLLEITQQSE